MDREHQHHDLGDGDRPFESESTPYGDPDVASTSPLSTPYFSDGLPQNDAQTDETMEWEDPEYQQLLMRQIEADDVLRALYGPAAVIENTKFLEPTHPLQEEDAQSVASEGFISVPKRVYISPYPPVNPVDPQFVQDSPAGISYDDVDQGKGPWNLYIPPNSIYQPGTSRFEVDVATNTILPKYRRQADKPDTPYSHKVASDDIEHQAEQQTQRLVQLQALREAVQQAQQHVRRPALQQAQQQVFQQAQQYAQQPAQPSQQSQQSDGDGGSDGSLLYGTILRTRQITALRNGDPQALIRCQVPDDGAVKFSNILDQDPQFYDIVSLPPYQIQTPITFHRNLVAGIHQLCADPATIPSMAFKGLEFVLKRLSSFTGSEWVFGFRVELFQKIYILKLVDDIDKSRSRSRVRPKKPHLVKLDQPTNGRFKRQMDVEVNFPSLRQAIPPRLLRLVGRYHNLGRSEGQIMRAGAHCIEIYHRQLNIDVPPLVTKITAPKGKDYAWTNYDRPSAKESDRAMTYLAHNNLQRLIPIEKLNKFMGHAGEAPGRTAMAAAEYIYELRDLGEIDDWEDTFDFD